MYQVRLSSVPLSECLVLVVCVCLNLGCCIFKIFFLGFFPHHMIKSLFLLLYLMEIKICHFGLYAVMKQLLLFLGLYSSESNFFFQMVKRY